MSRKKQSNRRTRRVYDDEFKAEAVRGSSTATQLSRSLSAWESPARTSCIAGRTSSLRMLDRLAKCLICGFKNLSLTSDATFYRI